jgi:hypothetical protein
MSKLNLKGKVIYPPGFWGINRPVVGANIEIRDIDAPGRHNDKIWEGQTNSQGVFQGQSSDWVDKIQIGVKPIPGSFPPKLEPIYGPDPTDILVLTTTIKQGNKEVTLPFPFLGDNVEVPPLLVPWGPIDPVPVVTVNGEPCYDPQEVASKVKSNIDNGKPLSISVSDLKKWIKIQRLPIAGVVEVAIPAWAAGTFLILVGVAILCLSASASALIMGVAVALILSAVLGYRVKHVEMKTDPSTGQTYLDLQMEKG